MSTVLLRLQRLVRKKEGEEKQKEERKATKQILKEEMKTKFEICMQKCMCKEKECKAIDLQKCSVCKNVQKSRCSKKMCKVDGVAPMMIYVAAKKKLPFEESDTDSEEEECDDDCLEVLNELSTKAKQVSCSTAKKSLFGMDAIKAVQEALDDFQNGQYFCVYYENTYYWGKALCMFSDDPESNVNEVDVTFLTRKLDGFWDWPKLKDEKRVSAKFILFGPITPEPPTKNGFKFPDQQAEKQYRLFKRETRLNEREKY